MNFWMPSGRALMGFRTCFHCIFTHFRTYISCRRQVRTGGNELENYDYDLLDAIKQLHMNCTGWADDLSAEKAEQVAALLQKRLDGWYASPPKSYRYDNAVMELCQAVLEEYACIRKDDPCVGCLVPTSNSDCGLLLCKKYCDKCR